MSEEIIKLFETEGGEFISPPSVFIDRLKKIKAVLFDWDGVFNDGFKSGAEGSIFSEVDAMGTNLLRYALWRTNGSIPVSAIMTGENNPVAIHLARRENFHAVYSKMKHKAQGFESFCRTFHIEPTEVLFFCDDVLDLEVARRSGVRIMMGRRSSVMLKKFVRDNEIADYITANDGGHHGVREGVELVTGLLGKFDEVVRERMIFSANYQQYLDDRKKVELIHTEG